MKPDRRVPDESRGRPSASRPRPARRPRTNPDGALDQSPCRSRGRWIALGLGLLVLWMAACARYEQWPPRLVGPPSRPDVSHDFRVLGWSMEGRPIFAHVFGRGPLTVLLVAGLHGNAPAGTRLLRQFMTHLREHPELLEGRRAVVVPLPNPDGGIRGTKNNARGVDLDRNFPASNWRFRPTCGTSAASEPEIHALLLALDTYKPSRILQIRSPLNQVSGPGPAVYLARRMAQASNYPYDPFPNPPASGSFAALTRHDRHIPTIVFDLNTRRPVPGLWKDIFPALEIFVRGE